MNTIDAEFLDDLTAEQVSRLHLYISTGNDFVDIVEAVSAEASGLKETMEAFRASDIKLAADVDYIMYGSKH